MSEEANAVLVIESNSSLAKMLSKALEQAGLQVTVVADGLEALEKMADMDLGLVITDYEMMDSLGTPVCRSLRQQKKYASLPMIVLVSAGVADPDELSSSLNLIAAYRKPISVKQVVAASHNALTGGGAEATDGAPPQPASADADPAPQQTADASAESSDAPEAEASTEPTEGSDSESPNSNPQ